MSRRSVIQVRDLPAMREKKKLSKVQRKQVKNMIYGTAELKYLVENNAVTDLDGYYDNSAIVLNNPIQGDADTQRDGDQIRMTSLDIKGIVKYDKVATVPGRLLIILVRPGNQDLGSAATITYNAGDILQNGSSAHVVVDHIRNDTRFRFQVLYDRTFVNDDNTGTALGRQEHFHKMINLRKKKVQFDAASSRITKNALVLLWLSDVATASGNGPGLAFDAKLRFVDI